MTGNHPLEPLRIADPDTYVWVRGQVEMLQPSPAASDLARLADETIWGLSLEPAMGAAYARGMIVLLGSASDARLVRYTDMVRNAALTGATLGRIVAEFAAVVIAAGEPLTVLFQSTMAVMLKKGTYTLTAPFELLKELIQDQAVASATAYLNLLGATFDRPLTYNQSLQLVYLLPKSIRRFSPHRRRFQIEHLTRVVRHDIALMEAFLEGLTKDLGLLDDNALAQFRAMGLERHARNPAMGISFLSLSSKVAQDICLGLQRAALLKQVGGQLGRYLAARVGRPVAVAPMASLGESAIDGQWVCSDGVQIYLPDEVSPYAHRDRNVAFLKTLVRMEAALFEFGTFDFDLERAADRYPELLAYRDDRQDGAGRDSTCDGERFISRFPIPDLAADLFSLFEFARHRRLAAHHYPGLMQRAATFMDDCRSAGSHHALTPLQDVLLYDRQPTFSRDPDLARIQSALIACFERQFRHDSSVETSAAMVNRAYACLETAKSGLPLHDRSCGMPFGRRIRWDLVSVAMSRYGQHAREIKSKLQAQGVDVYRSDLSRRLADQHGRLSPDDVVELVLARSRVIGRPNLTVALSPRALEMLLQKTGMPDPGPRHRNDSGFRYPEWDCTVQDYLFDHTCVHASDVVGDDGGAYYRRILARRGGLVARIRTAFELLKPQGMAMLRQWPEGDALDYRAMLDYVMDRRAGRMPSDRLFIKRLKQERDVAVQLLVDLSRSTANPVVSGDATVLDVTKEALVLFCEALDVVGDRYAIAGFSGAGRHAVDYYHIKQFDEPLHADIQSRIAALAPQRSTRMGAAVRHATAAIEDAPHRVRLIILISDGFPNDLGYKADYAIADTRKAITEARAKNVHVKAITVNIGSDPGLDALYGRAHHHVIGDVRELPDKLLRVYGTLTRN